MQFVLMMKSLFFCLFNDYKVLFAAYLNVISFIISEKHDLSILTNFSNHSIQVIVRLIKVGKREIIQPEVYSLSVTKDEKWLIN